MCSGCGTQLHADCRAQATRCPTLGCDAPLPHSKARPPRGSRLLGCAAISLLVLLVLWLLPWPWLAWRFAPGLCFFVFPRYADDRLVERLENRTDVAAVVSAARFLIARKEKLKESDGQAHSFVDSESEDMPVAFRALGFSYAGVHESGVMLECGGGFFHYGLRIEPDGGPDPIGDEKQCRWKKLGEGVWLYRDDVWRLGPLPK